MQPEPSEITAVHVSTSEIELVSAAKMTRMKNTQPMMPPASPMLLKTCGRMMNISDGPAFCATASPDPSAANVDGMIIRPASSEMANVVPAICMTLEVSFSFFSR